MTSGKEQDTIAKIEEILLALDGEATKRPGLFQECYSRTLQILQSVYGEDTIDVKEIVEANSRLRAKNPYAGVMDRHLIPLLQGKLQRTRDDLSVSSSASQRSTSLESTEGDVDFEHLLHPAIREHALPLWQDGHWREAVLNAFTSVFNLISRRTGLDLDGDQLATKVFSRDNPLLIVSVLTTESGKNDQVGFMQMLQGAYRGIRNPKAHSLESDLTRETSAQYLVFASLLARRVAESTSAGTQDSTS